jgi:hypothetical protein
VSLYGFDIFNISVVDRLNEEGYFIEFVNQNDSIFLCIKDNHLKLLV